MEKKVKFFWIYTIVLFASAFVLILFSAFSGTRIQEEKTETQRLYQGAQKSLTTLTQQNEILREENHEYKKTIEEMTQEIDELRTQAAASEEKNAGIYSSVENLLLAEDLVRKGEYKKAAEEIAKVNPWMLKGRAEELYNKLKGQIDKKR